MASLQIHYTTANLGRLPLNTTYFASSLCTTFKPTLPPDLIILALQEIAPIGYSFLGGSLLAPYFTHINEAVELATAWAFGEHVPEAHYEHVLTRNVGMTGIVLYAKQNVKEKIKWMEEAGTGVGLWDMGNKGAVGVRVGLETEGNEEDTVLTFVAAHLAPMEEACQRRNEDWMNICQTLVFEPTNHSDSRNDARLEEQPLLSSSSQDSTLHSLFYPPSQIFFGGDLNYRTQDTKPDPSDFESWPQPMSDGFAELSSLLKKDQLTQQLKAGKTLHHLAEEPIHFPPTYKYSARAQKLAEETAQAHGSREDSSDFPGLRLGDIQEQVWLWAKHRAPSWCDRIFYLASAPPTTVHSYNALPIQPTSDHRPVTLSCEIPWKPLNNDQIVRQPRYNITKDWKERRAASRKLELLIGIGAYLGFTGQGEALLAGTVVGLIGGYLALRWMIVSS